MGFVLGWPGLAAAQQCVDEVVCVEPVPVDDGSVEFHVENLTSAPLIVTLEAGDLLNFQPDAPQPRTATYPPHSRTRAFRLQRLRADQGWRYNYRFTWRPGVIGARHDDTYVYALPFAPGEAFRLAQGYGGDYSHTDEHALDWVMPEGTPIHAVRAGIVIAAVDTNRVGGPDRRYEQMANYVHVLHTDGTVAAYVHLMPEGARVQVGDVVQRGQLLGLSGSTGFASGPHLHVEVFRIDEALGQETVPVRFQLGRRAGVPREGRRYRARR